MNKKSRFEHLESIKNDPHTLIFYEAPHKLTRTLADMHKFFGNRKISIVRELTKIHEECVVTTIEDAMEFYETNYPKGEYVLIIEGKNPEAAAKEKRAEFEDLSICEHVALLMENGADKKEAMKKVAALRGISKRDVYGEMLREEEK